MSLKWVKMDTVKMREAVASNTGDDVRRAMLLQTYCALAENGGVIVGCGGWNRDKWQRLVGCYPPKDRRDAEGLWCWHGEDLVVTLYDVEAEKNVKLLRARGKHGGSMKGARGVSKVDDRGNAQGVKHSNQNKTVKAYGKADAFTDKIREEQKEINKEKGSGESLVGIDSPDVRAEFADMHAIVAGRLAE